MNKLSLIPISVVIFFGCSYDDKKYVCKNYDKNPVSISLKISGKNLILGTQNFKYCETVGNIKIYQHSSCKKNQYGNYASSINFDPIIKELSIIGSGGMLPIEVLQCSFTE